MPILMMRSIGCGRRLKRRSIETKVLGGTPLVTFLECRGSHAQKLLDILEDFGGNIALTCADVVYICARNYYRAKIFFHNKSDY